MSANRPFVLSIAGFDPSGGAGVLADVKTLEQHQVYGLAIVTGNTIQTENKFIKMAWIPNKFVIESIEVLCYEYDIKTVKIGIVPSLDCLENIVSTIKRIAPKAKMVWDTVLTSSTEFNFMSMENRAQLELILNQVDLITPNYHEIVRLGHSNGTPENLAKSLSKFCAVLLKGGHNPEALGTDSLFFKDEVIRILPETKFFHSKHGSGCVLSSAITANMALGFNIATSCKNAKSYTETFLNSSTTLLGYHHA